MLKFQFYKLFYDDALINEIFLYLRNLLYCSIVLAAGAHVHRTPPDLILDTIFRPYWGYDLIAIGIFLLVLSMINSIIKLEKMEFSRLTKIVFIIFHFILSIRIVMVVLYFRMQ